MLHIIYVRGNESMKDYLSLLSRKESKDTKKGNQPPFCDKHLEAMLMSLGFHCRCSR